MKNSGSSPNRQSFLRRVQKGFSTWFLLVYVLEEKYERCSWENMQNFIMKVSIVGQIFLQCSRKDTFVFTINVINHGINRETVYQTVRLIFQFSLEINIKFWKCFYSTVLCSLGSSCYKKQGVGFFGQNSLTSFPRCLYTNQSNYKLKLVFHSKFWRNVCYICMMQFLNFF